MNEFLTYSRSIYANLIEIYFGSDMVNEYNNIGKRFITMTFQFEEMYGYPPLLMDTVVAINADLQVFYTKMIKSIKDQNVGNFIVKEQEPVPEE